MFKHTIFKRKIPKLTTLAFKLETNGTKKHLVIDFDGWAKAAAHAAYRKKLRQSKKIKFVDGDDPTPFRIVVECNVIEEIAPVRNDAGHITVRGRLGNVEEMADYLPRPDGDRIRVDGRREAEEYVGTIPCTFRSEDFVGGIGRWPIVQVSRPRE
jgi:hypothetical protein